jgi:hypothetical protein
MPNKCFLTESGGEFRIRRTFSVRLCPGPYRHASVNPTVIIYQTSHRNSFFAWIVGIYGHVKESRNVPVFLGCLQGDTGPVFLTYFNAQPPAFGQDKLGVVRLDLADVKIPFEIEKSQRLGLFRCV